jgi:hypothetical protein
MSDLSNSCMTLALQITSIFISSFPGYIVLGKIQQYSYEKGKYFKFGIFDLHKLYLTIVEVLNFFTDVNTESSSPKIFHQDEESEENYFWSGHSVTKFGNSFKIISFGIEKDGNITFELKVYLKEFQNLFFCLRNVMIASLCLNPNEHNLIEYASVQKIETLKCIQSEISRQKSAEEPQSEKYLKDFINLFHQKYNIKAPVYFGEYIEIIRYYFEIIIILQKLKSLEIIEVTNREEIIKNII